MFLMFYFTMILQYKHGKKIKSNVLRKLIISCREYAESYRHNQTFDLQPKTYYCGIDIRLSFLVSIARTTDMNMSVERQGIAN